MKNCGLAEPMQRRKGSGILQDQPCVLWKLTKQGLWIFNNYVGHWVSMENLKFFPPFHPLVHHHVPICSPIFPNISHSFPPFPHICPLYFPYILPPFPHICPLYSPTVSPFNGHFSLPHQFQWPRWLLHSHWPRNASETSRSPPNIP